MFYEKFFACGALFLLPFCFTYRNNYKFEIRTYKYIVLLFKYLQTFPFAFVLMSNKKQKAYEHVLQYIDSNIFKFDAKSFTTDFEKSMRNAILSVFPHTKIKGCWFHFCQAVRRKASKIKQLSRFLQTSTEAKRIFQKILVLPLLKDVAIEEAFNICKMEAYANPLFATTNENVFEPLFKYFEVQWLKKVTS